MIINENGLCRAMKQAYKRDGYTVMAEDGAVMLWTTEWFVQEQEKKMPRKVMALVVEHMGAMPGKPTHLQKGTEPQIVMECTAETEVGDWTDGATARRTGYVSMTVSGWQMMQERESLKCWAVEGESLDIVDSAVSVMQPGIVMEPCKIAWMHESELVVLEAHRPPAGNWLYEAWEALESIKLTD